jgi:hypothetical protein
MKREAIWVRKFICRTCGKTHRVEGPRRTLGEEQKKREDECETKNIDDKQL